MRVVRVSLTTFLFRSYVQELMSCAVVAVWCLLIEGGIDAWCACDSSFIESEACLTAGVCKRNDLSFDDIAFLFLPDPYRAHRLLIFDGLASPAARQPPIQALSPACTGGLLMLFFFLILFVYSFWRGYVCAFLCVGCSFWRRGKMCAFACVTKTYVHFCARVEWRCGLLLSGIWELPAKAGAGGGGWLVPRACVCCV